MHSNSPEEKDPHLLKENLIMMEEHFINKNRVKLNTI